MTLYLHGNGMAADSSDQKELTALETSPELRRFSSDSIAAANQAKGGVPASSVLPAATPDSLHVPSTTVNSQDAEVREILSSPQSGRYVSDGLAASNTATGGISASALIASEHLSGVRSELGRLMSAPLMANHASPGLAMANEATDPQALRTELIGRAAGIHLQLEKLIGALRASGVPVPPDADSQLTDILVVQREIALARPADLPALTRQVSAMIAATAATVQQAQTASAQVAAATLADAAEASHHAVQSAMDYTRGLTLRFTSDEDERGYRDREAERAAYIAAQHARHTPEGDLNASGATVGQMVDARAHGAGGPEFEKHWNELVETTAKLRDAVHARGDSTKEFDDRLRADLRRVMKSKGLSDAEIDARFAANPDPLEAAKAYVSDEDVQHVKQKVGDSVLPTEKAEVANATPPPSSPASSDPYAKLRSAGVAVSEPTGTDYVHGVTASVANATPSRAQG